MDVTTLLSARRRGWRNQLTRSAQDRRAQVALVALVALALVIGHAAAPGLLEPPLETATPSALKTVARARLAAGANALEVAFWLTMLLGSVSSFRVMELLFRRPEIRAIAHLPLSARALFVDRLLYGLADAAALASAASLLFVPLVWHGGGWAAACAISLVWLGLLVVLGVGLGVQLFAGASEFGTGQPGERAAVDLYGGPGQLFLFAPGVALGISAVAVLVLKLGLGEALRTGALGRATGLGVGVGLAVGAAGLVTGWRDFQRGYLRMLAGFREADFVGFEPPIDYQQSAYAQPRRLEALLPTPQAARVYRRHVLQYGRRFALVRLSYGVLWLLYGIAHAAFSPAALPVWASAAAALLLLGVMANPFARLHAPGVATAARQALPIDPADERRAATLYGAVEALRFGLPLALLLALTRGVQHGLWIEAGMAAAVITLGSPGLATLSRGSRLTTQLATLTGAIILAALGAWTLPGALGLAALLSLATLASARR